MLLTITTTHRPATDLGFLLHKNPSRCQSFALSFGKAHVFYPEATTDTCTAALLMDVDPIDMVRGRSSRNSDGLLDHYINDRPYVASSFLSVAIAKVFGAALNNRCARRPELLNQTWPLHAHIAALPARGGEDLLRRLFEPLGYSVAAQGHVLDEDFPSWGASHYYTVDLRKQTTVGSLLNHLYVLIPVLDNKKHYYIAEAELHNLLRKGEGWLASHPERDLIARRYLKNRPSLTRQALERLAAEDLVDDDLEAQGAADDTASTEAADADLSLNEQRMGCVLAALKASKARRVLDLGCGEGKLLRLLMRERQFEQITGVDVSVRALEHAHRKLHLDTLTGPARERIQLLHGSLMYRDERFEGFDAVAVVEVVEHLDPPRLKAFERVLFECARPQTIVLSTPNREYNVLWEGMEADQLRHPDHRFEWTRAEFAAWAEDRAQHCGYTVRFLPVGPEDAQHGPPTQMGIFSR